MKIANTKKYIGFPDNLGLLICDSLKIEPLFDIFSNISIRLFGGIKSLLPRGEVLPLKN